MHCSQYGKLVQCVRGSVTDFMVDLREESPTFLKWKSVELSENDAVQVYIQPRCGRGFFCKENNSLLVYCQEGTFNPPKEMNINPFDPLININWPLADYIISDQDKNALNASEAIKLWKERNFS
jgi:dTDP-4-dehydrorhamnose 3,5-epimerase-like enzyme